jgi:DNA-binding IclR family transcriptional regulator
MPNQTYRTVLRVLYAMARDDSPADLSVVAEALGLSCVDTDRLLARLEDAGLVDADRVRLTLTGLALAVNLSDRPARSGCSSTRAA